DARRGALPSELARLEPRPPHAIRPMELGDVPYYLALAALYGVALWNCYRVLGHRPSPGAAIAWILINLRMPVGAPPSYFLLGQNRLTGYVKKHRARAKELDESSPTWTRFGAAPEADHGIQPHYQVFRTVLSRFGPIFAPHEGDATLL